MANLRISRKFCSQTWCKSFLFIKVDLAAFLDLVLSHSYHCLANGWHGGKSGKGLLLFFIELYCPLKTSLSNLYSEGHSATFSDVFFMSKLDRVYVQPQMWHPVHCQSQYIVIIMNFKRPHSRTWNEKLEVSLWTIKNWCGRLMKDKGRGRKTKEKLHVFPCSPAPTPPSRFRSSGSPIWKHTHRKSLLLSLSLSCSNTGIAAKPAVFNQDSFQSLHLIEIWDEIIGVTKSKSFVSHALGVGFNSLSKCATGNKVNIIKLLPFLLWSNYMVWCDILIWVTGAAAIQYSLQRSWIPYKVFPKVLYQIASQQFFERLHWVTRTLNPYMA